MIRRHRIATACAAVLAAAGLLSGCLPRVTEEGRSARRAAIFHRLQGRWDSFRIASYFSVRRLVVLRGLCYHAEHAWGGDIKKVFLAELREFGEMEVISYFRQDMRFDTARLEQTAALVLAVGGELRQLRTTQALTTQEIFDAWGPAEHAAAWVIDSQWEMVPR